MVFLTGSAWGGIAGAGRLWIVGSQRPKFITVPLVSLISGMGLMLVYAALRQLSYLKQPFALWLVFIVGFLVPFVILLAENGALYASGRRN